MRVQDRDTTSPLDVISVADAKTYMRVDHSADDALIEDLIVAANAQVEAMANTKVRALNAYAYLDDFRNSDFPVGPVVSIGLVEYKASGDTYTTLDTSKYWFSLTSHPARIEFDAYPDLEDEALDRVRISFEYGFDNVNHMRPSQYKQAVLILVTHLYENRSPVVMGATPKAVPMSLEALVSTFRQL